MWAPMLFAYALPRCVKADGSASSPEPPTHGLAPGCPGATDWLAMLALCWTAPVTVLDDYNHARDYVDDLVGWGRPPPGALCVPKLLAAKVLRIWQFTQRFRDATTWKLNEGRAISVRPLLR